MTVRCYTSLWFQGMTQFLTGAACAELVGAAHGARASNAQSPGEAQGHMMLSWKHSTSFFACLQVLHPSSGLPCHH